MQFQGFVKPGPAHKALERPLAHFPHIFKTKMIRDQRFDLFDVVIREAELPADPLGHPRADFDMSIEAYPRAGLPSWRKGRRLAYVVKQHAPSESGRTIRQKPLEQHSRVNPNIL